MAHKLMSFHIDDDKLLKKYKTIWAKIEDLKNLELNALLVYDDRYTKIFLKFVGILMRCVGKIPRLNVVGKFGLFYHKKMKSRILSICSPTEIKLLQVVTPFKEVI